MTLGEITAAVEQRLSVKRFAHSLAVAAQAVKLARQHREDPTKAYTAAILHDIAREWQPDAWLKWAADHGSAYDRYRTPPVLLHGFIGEQIARDDFFIHDLEVLEAIRYHSLGFPGMGKQAQILFIADYISRDREFIDEDFRRLIAHSSLQNSLLAVAQATASYMIKTGRSIHPDTEQMVIFFKERSR